MAHVTLRKITVENYEAAGDLYLPEIQQSRTPHNMRSIAESMFKTSSHETRAIYSAENLVGFAMWERESGEWVHITRLMIAHGYQRQGLGKLALREITNEIMNIEKPDFITVQYHRDNCAAKALCHSIGFGGCGFLEKSGEVSAVMHVGLYE